MPVRSPIAGDLSFRLNGKTLRAADCICLFRSADAEALLLRYLLLTRDRRFVCLDRGIGGKGPHAAEEWSPSRAQRFLIEHGEGDLVDEFPDIFRKRPAMAAAQPAAPRAARKPHPAEPFLFPLS